MDNSNSMNSFLLFNGSVIAGIAILGIVDYLIKPSKSAVLKSKMIVKTLFPLMYFALFSFFFGSLFLVGNNMMMKVINEHLPNQTLDLGIVASYTGVLSIVIATFFKSIVQKLFGVKIVSTPIHDIGGFIIGRIALIFSLMLMK